jgi:hypothetical protein
VSFTSQFTCCSSNPQMADLEGVVSLNKAMSSPCLCLVRTQQAGAICKPGRDSHKEPSLLLPLSWTSSLQNSEKCKSVVQVPLSAALCDSSLCSCGAKLNHTNEKIYSCPSDKLWLPCKCHSQTLGIFDCLDVSECCRGVRVGGRERSVVQMYFLQFRVF